jgi:hypothetical protein
VAPSKRGGTLFGELMSATYWFFNDSDNRRRWFPRTTTAPLGRPGFVAAFHIEDGVWAPLTRMGWVPREIIGYVGVGRLRWRFRRRVRDRERLLRSAEKRSERRRRQRQRSE